MGGIVGVVSSVKKRYCFGLCEMRPRKYLVDDFELERDIARIRTMLRSPPSPDATQSKSMSALNSWSILTPAACFIFWDWRGAAFLPKRRSISWSRYLRRFQWAAS